MQEKENVIIKGSTPELSSDNKYVYYGLYPQTNVDDCDLIKVLNKLTNQDERGYYFYNNEYYYKLASAEPDDSEYKFDNGNTIEKGKSYWFKVEPIKWRILLDEGDSYFLFSDSILINHIFNEDYVGIKTRTDYQGNTDIVYPNNYKYSEIRTFINTDFYKQAFFLDDSFIKVSEVDNSVESTLDDDNQYVCENTFDKLFLLSTEELTIMEYRFDSNSYGDDTARILKITDYARAVGAYICIEQNSVYNKNGWFYLRSPGCDNSGSVRNVSSDGYFDGCNYVGCSSGGAAMA